MEPQVRVSARAAYLTVQVLSTFHASGVPSSTPTQWLSVWLAHAAPKPHVHANGVGGSLATYRQVRNLAMAVLGRAALL